MPRLIYIITVALGVTCAGAETLKLDGFAISSDECQIILSLKGEIKSVIMPDGAIKRDSAGNIVSAGDYKIKRNKTGTITSVGGAVIKRDKSGTIIKIDAFAIKRNNSGTIYEVCGSKLKRDDTGSIIHLGESYSTVSAVFKVVDD